jgi:hypothetical protein
VVEEVQKVVEEVRKVVEEVRKVVEEGVGGAVQDRPACQSHRYLDSPNWNLAALGSVHPSTSQRNCPRRP